MSEPKIGRRITIDFIGSERQVEEHTELMMHDIKKYLDVVKLESPQQEIVVAQESLPIQCFADVCVDFDGVIHSYESGWINAHTIPDPPVPGAIETLHQYIAEDLELAIHSARSAAPGGIDAMKIWLAYHDDKWTAPGYRDFSKRPRLIDVIAFPVYKPAAGVYLDDRGMRFDGTFPTTEELKQARENVWYKETPNG